MPIAFLDAHVANDFRLDADNVTDFKLPAGISAAYPDHNDSGIFSLGQLVSQIRREFQETHTANGHVERADSQRRRRSHHRRFLWIN